MVEFLRVSKVYFGEGFFEYGRDVFYWTMYISEVIVKYVFF